MKARYIPNTIVSKGATAAGWLFGEPVLRSGGLGRANWSTNYTQKGGGWTADLYGGVQSGDDWAACYIPVNELSIPQFTTAEWSWYQTAAETMGLGIVIWVHDQTDFDKRAEVTQLGGVAGLEHAAGWNAHEFDSTDAGMFFYGENTTGTDLTAGTQYTWAQFQTDTLFSTWSIYRISFDWGWEASGTFESVYLAEVKFNDMYIPLAPATPPHLKTIQTELLAITAVAADAQQKSSELDLTNISTATILIDHGRTATTAFVVAGTEYAVQVSQKATGNDTWRTIASVVCDITAASEITAAGAEAAGQTVIETASTTGLAAGDIVFWVNTTLANSEWGKIVSLITNTSFTLLDGLTNAQAAAQKIYNKAQQFALSFNVTGFTRLRVVVNNANGTTNAAIKSRIACITEV